MLLIIEDIINELKRQCSVDLDSFTNDFIISKIKQKMDFLRIDIPQIYLNLLRNDPAEADLLLMEFGINVSSFFRNSLVFELIEQRILPRIIVAKQKNHQPEIRIWSAGCARGEEPYSIAILLQILLQKKIEKWKIQIFATDIDKKRLEYGKTGLFKRKALVNTKLGVIDTYFSPEGKEFRINKNIRQMVDFSVDDLASNETTAPAASVFGSFDLILCRNVLIYFNPKTKKRVIKKISTALNREGYLIMGESEWLMDHEKNMFSLVDDINKIFRKNSL